MRNVRDGRRRLALLVGLAAALAIPSAVASPQGVITAAQAVAGLNALRAANGIPGRVVLNARWSQACRKHNLYQEKNNAFGHPESPSQPGYSKDGEWASQHSLTLLGQIPATWDGLGPWGVFPYHLFPLLAPQFVATGFDATPRVACMVVDAPGSYRNSVPKKDSIYTFPGNGATGVAVSLRVIAELPRTPAADVGLRSDGTTGPNIYVYADGPWAHCGKIWCDPITIVAATLAPADTPGAKVKVRWTKRSQYPYPSQILVPVSPLQPGTEYMASVIVRIGKITHTYSWSFTTA